MNRLKDELRVNALRPALRLRLSVDFASILKQGPRYRDAAFHLYYRDNSSKLPRLGLAVSKRVSNRASQRNKIKRVLREAFRTLSRTLPPIDLVVLVRASADVRSRIELRERFVKALTRLALSESSETR